MPNAKEIQVLSFQIPISEFFVFWSVAFGVLPSFTTRRPDGHPSQAGILASVEFDPLWRGVAHSAGVWS
jgi:hypothetical protein